VTTALQERGIPKLRTEIEGFDLIAEGGVPKGRSTLLSGTSASPRASARRISPACS
jgi:hypothetical protein